MSHKVAFIGTGPDPENPDWGTSAAMAYRHATGYATLETCELVGCADIVREHGEAFAERYEIPTEHVYEDYEAMIDELEPDIISVSTPVPTHAEIVIDVAESGIVDVIHCEKPMADTWKDCQRMTEICDAAGVQLTFNHQRRFDPIWQEALRLVEEGTIGELKRLEMGGKNLFDFGTHLFDLCNAFNAEREPEWILAGLDYREADVRYGSHNENHAIAQWAYDNGVYGIASTGDGWPVLGAQLRVLGTTGRMEVQVTDGPDIRYQTEESAGWVQVSPSADGHSITRAIAHLVECYETGDQPAIGSESALRSTQLIYGAWESVRDRSRIEFPLTIEDNPLEAMVESGALSPD